MNIDIRSVFCIRNVILADKKKKNIPQKQSFE